MTHKAMAAAPPTRRKLDKKPKSHQPKFFKPRHLAIFWAFLAFLSPAETLYSFMGATSRYFSSHSIKKIVSLSRKTIIKRF